LSLLVILIAPAAGWTQELQLTVLDVRLRASVVVLEIDEVLGEPESIGTGFFISSDGLVATNAHVVGTARTISARFHDGLQVRVESVVALDRGNDLAIVQVEPGEYSTLELGASASVVPGERIVVLGNPLGLDFTLSEGIVSAVREAGQLGGRGPQGEHLQISAPISFGSSGSPVLNLQGRVVGIVSSGYVAAQNLNFAIPVDLLKNLMANADDEVQPRMLKARSPIIPLVISAVFFVLLFAVFKFFLKDGR
jgi:S1-C subfamily serine protease